MYNNYSEVCFINDYRGETADKYTTHLNYVERGGWEKDYFASWLEGCSDYPPLSEIADFCREIDSAILIWLEGVAAGAIDPEVCYEEQGENILPLTDISTVIKNENPFQKGECPPQKEVAIL